MCFHVIWRKAMGIIIKSVAAPTRPKTLESEGTTFPLSLWNVNQQIN